MKKVGIIVGTIILIILGGLIADSLLSLSPDSLAKTVLIVGLSVIGVLELVALFTPKKKWFLYLFQPSVYSL